VTVNDGSSPTVTGCAFSGNESGRDGDGEVTVLDFLALLAGREPCS
jgi:hypothetical protein